jgi:TPR repeat protein
MAKKYFRLAAEQGFVRAQMNLGLPYMYTKESDMVNTLKYYEIGANKGQVVRMRQVGEVLLLSSSVLVQKGCQQGRRRSRRNIESDTHVCQLREGTEVDQKKSFGFISKKGKGE